MKALNGFLVTGNLERRMYVSIIQKLHRPRMSDLADTVDVTVIFDTNHPENSFY